MDNRLRGKLVICDWCGIKKYKEPSRIRKHNFCNHEHRKLYLASDKNIDMSKGWRQSKEVIKKISNASKGHKMTQDNLEKIKESNRQRIWTEEAREKLRKANLGKKLSEETKSKIRLNAKHGEKNNQWKGMDASYQAKHMFVTQSKGRPTICVDCNVTEEEKKIEWSNIDNEHSRNPDDYVARCVSCHRKYDIKNFNYPVFGDKGFKKGHKAWNKDKFFGLEVPCNLEGCKVMIKKPKSRIFKTNFCTAEHQKEYNRIKRFFGKNSKKEIS